MNNMFTSWDQLEKDVVYIFRSNKVIKTDNGIFLYDDYTKWNVFKFIDEYQKEILAGLKKENK